MIPMAGTIYVYMAVKVAFSNRQPGEEFAPLIQTEPAEFNWSCLCLHLGSDCYCEAI